MLRWIIIDETDIVRLRVRRPAGSTYMAEPPLNASACGRVPSRFAPLQSSVAVAILMLLAAARPAPCSAQSAQQQASPPSAAAQAASAAKPPSPDPPRKTRAPQPQTSKSGDDAVVRQLELLMLLEMMKDYALFYDDPKPAEKTRVKP
jgi:hypothetical protein